MSVRGRGRPPANGQHISTAKILVETLRILDAEGLERLTMRAVAARVGINPMTIYHHFKDRDGLIRALADSVYADISAPGPGDGGVRIASLLTAYYSKVVQHPALTLAIFSRPAVFPNHAKRISADLTNLLGEMGLSPARALLWMHILVDFTHGAALAVAVRSETGQLRSPTEREADSYADGLGELLRALDRSAS